jgi:L-ascorbate metabolism protein UlaG (beta-lactamase superfamily)
MNYSIIALFSLSVLFGCKSNQEKEIENQLVETVEEAPSPPASIELTPISHATMVLQWGETIVYVDPVGGKEAFEGQPAPDLILVTDIHGDHLNAETLSAVSTDQTTIVVPQAVADKLSQDLGVELNILGNGQKTSAMGIEIEGIPMYNLREEALQFHVKGRGNGYVLEKDGDRVYISGDTEDIPEMRNLKDIDMAFVCMNLPYTMTVESAADAVLAFAPETVIPYHYRGTEGLSDVAKFKQLVTSGNASIEVVQLDWYPEKN